MVALLILYENRRLVIINRNNDDFKSLTTISYGETVAIDMVYDKISRLHNLYSLQKNATSGVLTMVNVRIDM